MQTQTTQTTETLTVETQPVTEELTPKGEGEEVLATVSVEPATEKPVEEPSSLVPAVVAVLVALVGLVAAVKKLKSK